MCIRDSIDGLLDVARDLLGHGNSVVLVDHDARMLRAADRIVEMGPGAGRDGGTVVCQGAVDDVRTNPASLIGPFLGKGAPALVRERTAAARLFDEGTIRLSTAPLHTVHALDLELPDVYKRQGHRPAAQASGSARAPPRARRRARSAP